MADDTTAPEEPADPLALGQAAASQLGGVWQLDADVPLVEDEIPADIPRETPDTANPPRTRGASATRSPDEPSTLAIPPSPEQLVEAMLFVGGHPLTTTVACSAVRGLTAERFQAAIDALNRRYRDQRRPYAVEAREDGFVLAVRPTYRNLRERLFGGPRETRLSQPALDVLSVIAYRQPVGKAEVDAIRGTDSGSVLRQLVRLGLVAVRHRAEAADREVRYGTTPRFLQVFGLASLDELPRLGDPAQVQKFPFPFETKPVADNRRTLLGWVWPPPPIAGRLWIAVAASFVYSALVCALGETGAELQPLWSTQFALLNGAILGLLVSFRTKVAHDRWWEGRIIWGQLTNHSRNLCLKVRELANPDPGERAAFAALVAAFPVALMRHLRGPLQLNELDDFRDDPASPTHVPAHIAGKLIATVAAWRAAGRFDGHAHQMLDTHLAALMDVCGACERIRVTPLPGSYLALLRHGLVLGFLFSPWALLHTLGAWEMLVLPVAVYFLFGIELTAEAVEQPFGYDGDDLPLETFCETIRVSANDILK